mmetsp:Transcript_15697/g.42164  ORF Transcript_15697/g.42164 Transcript_15697/m.42164 type:complete len:121 (-) Transcript_15697:173-535(-)|eukprot:CAMPEP_0185181808 /NCGR_PEP_ID=MMETSP1140-20130426/896_1 /TAXON_ID=298111 /ORGANISM="Pavlova sp., Strain CCMP459" /LENGTH=120 /DNA_ID=CAMNT_0027747703 /DNA_START=53 /DNA_END=415 /DNA_ORIENTATION=+
MESATMRGAYPEMYARLRAKRLQHYSTDIPNLLIQTKEKQQPVDKQKAEELRIQHSSPVTYNPELAQAEKPPPPPLPEKTEQDIKLETLMHRSISFRRQHDGGFFTTGGPTSNLCAFQVP